MLSCFGQWMQEERPEANRTVNFDDVTLLLGGDVAEGGAREAAVQKPSQSADNNRYLLVKVKQEDEDRLSVFLCTTFAGCPEGRILDMTMEALAFHGKPINASAHHYVYWSWRRWQKLPVALMSWATSTKSSASNAFKELTNFEYRAVISLSQPP